MQSTDLKKTTWNNIVINTIFYLYLILVFAKQVIYFFDQDKIGLAIVVATVSILGVFAIIRNISDLYAMYWYSNQSYSLVFLEDNPRLPVVLYNVRIVFNNTIIFDSGYLISTKTDAEMVGGWLKSCFFPMGKVEIDFTEEEIAMVDESNAVCDFDEYINNIPKDTLHNCTTTYNALCMHGSSYTNRDESVISLDFTLARRIQELEQEVKDLESAIEVIAFGHE